jgi:Histidine kinase
MIPVLETPRLLGLRERRQLERDLPDGPQQRLVSLALSLRMAQDKLDSEPGEARRLLERSRGEIDAALKELRERARMRPGVLRDHGLRGRRTGARQPRACASRGRPTAGGQASPGTSSRPSTSSSARR